MMGLRDGLARKLNKPGFQVAPREVLMDVTFHPELFEKWKELDGLHHALRNRESMEAYRSAWTKGQAQAEQLKLSKKSASSGLPPAEREKLALERKRLAIVVDEKYRPVLEKIAEQYGKFTASYILNEKTMTELAAGRLKLESLPYIYRQDLIINTAQKLGISLF
jgi:hypothetical protein